MQVWKASIPYQTEKQETLAKSQHQHTEINTGQFHPVSKYLGISFYAHYVVMVFGDMYLNNSPESESISHLSESVWLFVTPWTVAHQAPLSMGFFKQEY